MSKTKSALPPCPFCGSPARQDSGFSPMEEVTYAYCSNNECPLHDVYVGFTPETWCRRALKSKPQEASGV